VHSDPIGTIVFPLLQFFTTLPLIGWAKPVPVNPAHLRNPSRDQVLISLAGPGANLVAAVASFLLLVVLKASSTSAAGLVMSMAGTMRIPRYASPLTPLLGILFFAMVINLALALFNLIPVPPLDGHWVLRGVLPEPAARVLEGMSSYGFVILYGLAFLGMLRFVFVPVQWVRVLLLSV
jgi:Zn-dependent protease